MDLIRQPNLLSCMSGHQKLLACVPSRSPIVCWVSAAKRKAETKPRLFRLNPARQRLSYLHVGKVNAKEKDND